MLSRSRPTIRREGLASNPIARAAAWLGGLLVLGLASSAGATTMTFAIQEIIGGDSEVTITLSDEGVEPGTIQLTAEVTEGRGDLRGLYFDLVDGIDSIMIEAIGSEPDELVLSEIVEIGSFIDVGPGGNLRGGPNPVEFDFGIEIGSPGPARDSYSEIVLLITTVEGATLDLTAFSEQLFGARLTSPGRKLRGQAPVIVPEPTTAALTALGFAMLAVAGRRRS